MRRAGFAWPTEPCMIKQMNTTCWALHSSKHRDAAATTSRSHKASKVYLVPTRARFQPFCQEANLGSSTCDTRRIGFCKFGAYATDDQSVSASLVLMPWTTMCLLVCIHGSQRLPYMSESYSLVFPNPIGCCLRGYSVDQPLASTITTLKVKGIPCCQLAASSACYIYGLQTAEDRMGIQGRWLVLNMNMG